MTDNILHIQYNRGEMKINLQQFLPIAQARLKKLLKINEMDWTNREENIQQMIRYCKEEIQRQKKEREKIAINYWKDSQDLADTNRRVESGKHPNGVCLTETEYKQQKEHLKNIKRRVSESISRNNACLRKIEKLEKNLETLRKEATP